MQAYHGTARDRQIRWPGVRGVALGRLFAEVSAPGHRWGDHLGDGVVLSVDMEEAAAIGVRARMIRRRRGLSLDVVAGLAGITKQYLSALELGQRGFNRRGLIEDLAKALGCSVADLTGQPYPALDRATKDALATLPSIRLVLNDFGPTDVPDVTPRPLEVLASLADEANEHCGQAHYSLARDDIGSLLAESQASALTVPAARRDQAFTAAVTTCFVAGVVSSRAGNVDLAATAALRGYDLAQQHDNPALLGVRSLVLGS